MCSPSFAKIWEVVPFIVLIWPGIIYLYTTLTDGQNLPFVHLCGVIILTDLQEFLVFEYK